MSMITEAQKQRAISNAKQEAFEERQIKLKLPDGWQEVFPTIAFCKICHRSFPSFRAIKSPGKGYYHRKCIHKSQLFKKMGGEKL